MSAWIILFEISFEGESLPEQVLRKDLLTTKVPIKGEGKQEENPIYMHCWLFFFELLQFSHIFTQVSKINIVDKSSQIEIQRKIADTSLIRPWLLGDELLFETQADFGEQALVIHSSEGIQGDLFLVGDQELIKKDHIWYAGDESRALLDFYRFLIYRRNILKIYCFITSRWLDIIGEESVNIRDRLGETNKLYWSRLRGKLEVWDLNYLAFFTACSNELNCLERADIPILTGEFRDRVMDEFISFRDQLQRNSNDIKYGLTNLKTPCEAHDEDLLQKETEKGTERIMLLSFLAMSIPLLGAILAPGISPLTKILSAILLLTAPIAYSSIRRIQLRREHRKAHLAYLRSQHDGIHKDIEKAQESINSIMDNPKLNDKTKADTVAYLERSMGTAKKHLEQIEHEIARLS